MCACCHKNRSFHFHVVEQPFLESTVLAGVPADERLSQ